MHTKKSLMRDIENAGIQNTGTLLVHSSMKAVGEVEGKADAVLDAFIAYMEDGLLVFPTHTWSEKNLVDGIYNPVTEEACVGILPNLFRKREGAIRSMHPTHSVAAMGKRANEYVSRDEGYKIYTPCPRHGCFGGLYDEEAQLLFLGVDFKRNTYIHSLEEWLDIPNRINPKPRTITFKYEDDYTRDVQSHGHSSTFGSISNNYGKLLSPLLEMGIARECKIGDATSYVVDVKPMTDWVLKLLEENPFVFDNDEPLE